VKTRSLYGNDDYLIGKFPDSFSFDGSCHTRKPEVTSLNHPVHRKESQQ